jgi:hypothetical protein
MNQKATYLYRSIHATIMKKTEAQRTIITESNKVRLSRIRSAVRKDVERVHSKKISEKRDSTKEIKLMDWNRHITDADLDIRQWHTGDVLAESGSWRSSKFDIRKRIFVLVWILSIFHVPFFTRINYASGTPRS